MLRKSKSLKINNIKLTKLFISEYIAINFIIFDEFNNKTVNVRFTRYIYIVENFKTNVFLNNNIFDLKNINVHINKQKFIVDNYNNFSISLKVVIKDNKRVNCTIRFQIKIFVLFYICMSMLIKFCNSKLFIDKNIIFNSNYIEQLKKTNNLFFYIINANFCAIQVRNVINVSITIIKNKRLNTLIDYEKKNCYLISSKIRYFVVEL